MMQEPQDPLATLSFALEKYPQQVEAVPLRRVLLDSARENPKRPAYVKLAVPDAVVKAVRGSAEQSDLVLLVRVPKEVMGRQGSRIVLPGEVG
jgi:hypothetical protein